MKTNDVNNIAGAFFWNTAASILNALQSVVFLAVITRISGAYMGGVFSFAYMVGQQFRPLGAFEMRVYQATDVEDRFSFGTYGASRIITSFLMIVFIIGTSLYSEGLTAEAACVVSVALLRVLDVVEDVFHGKLQRLGRLDVAARALTIRILITSVVFCASFVASHDLLIASLVSLVASSIALYVLNIPISRSLFDLEIDQSDFCDLVQLFKACFPLFLAAFLSGYLPNASKFAVEEMLSKESLAQYSVLFLPAMVINLMCGFVFQPLLSNLAESLSAKGVGSFVKMLARGLTLASILGIVVAAMAASIGIPLLELIYKIELDGLSVAFWLLMLAGIFNACDTVMYYALVTIRAQKLALFVYAADALLAFLFTRFLVEDYGLAGAAFSYAATMLLLFILSALALKLALQSRIARIDKSV